MSGQAAVFGQTAVAPFWRWLTGLPRDRVVLALAALLGGSALAAGTQTALRLASEAGASLAETGIFIAASVLIAAVVKATGSDRLIARALSGRQETAILTAAVFGALSPF